MADALERSMEDWFADLEKTGVALLGAAQNASDRLSGEQLAKVAAWLTSIEQLLKSVFDAGGPYWTTVANIVERENSIKSPGGFYDIHSENHHQVSIVLGALRGARDDFKKGRMCKVRDLVRAEVFSDFLAMARHFHETGYKDPAAMVAGAVLEQSLRRLAVRHNVNPLTDIGKKKTLQPLNEELAKAGAYGLLVQRQVAVCIEIRNRADHGEFDAYTGNQVRDMISFIGTFCASH